jgi:D-alanyl-D-alanine carboxypeptidase/D-alanyl-D-alanine-endopeptidase (penicillin-binding protein 4)
LTPAEVVARTATPQNWQRTVGERLDALTEEAKVKARSKRASESPDEGSTRLEQRLDSLLETAQSGTRTAVYVQDLTNGETLADFDGSRLLNPASNQKLVTTMAAIELLGTDYRFETRTLRDGDTLYLVGEGDPSLREADLHTLARETLESDALEGVERIVVDTGAFSERRFGPGYDSRGSGESYMAPSGALSLNYNTVVVTVRPGSMGDAARITTSPQSDHVVIENETTTGGGEPLAAHAREEDGRTVVTVEGAIVGGHAPVKLRRRIHDPGAFTGEAFARILREAAGPTGARLPVEHGQTPAEARTLATHRSKPLVDVLASALKYSNNFTTEQVLRTLAWRATNEPGDWKRGLAVIADFWACIEDAPERADEMQPVNGSGLSRDGRVSAAALVDVLALTARDDSPSATLLATFARAGGEGTLRRRLGFAGARVRAKTGTIAGASALSGVVTSSDGDRRVGFSILVNGGDAQASRAFQDRVVSAILHDIDRVE